MLAFSAQMFIRHYLFHKVDSIFIRMMHTEKFEYEKCATFGLLGSNLKKKKLADPQKKLRDLTY